MSNFRARNNNRFSVALLICAAIILAVTLYLYFSNAKIELTLHTFNEHKETIRVDKGYNLDDYTLEEHKGYAFNGWYLDSELTNKFESITSSRKITLYASWTIVDYNLTYNLDGGFNSLNNPSTYNINTPVVLEDAHKPGYIFIGWFSNGVKITHIIGVSASDIELNAVYEVELV
ncbi:MAG: InlB B-repeat-containing protein [Acholeplasmatales bacterium]|jgi:uncharacterized repeat protein (TIGR02543 family)|nr:InlB B-repeat-containing protein [Acholeplasmatales bacterium]